MDSLCSHIQQGLGPTKLPVKELPGALSRSQTPVQFLTSPPRPLLRHKDVTLVVLRHRRTLPYVKL